MTLTHRLTNNDIAKICSWVSTHSMLQNVSGDRAECLNQDILIRWLNEACKALLIHDTEPLAFCTLSDKEVPSLPETYIELCHLIVDPKHNFYRNGDRLLFFWIYLARNLGYEYICGRVQPDNSYGVTLVRENAFDEFTGSEPWEIPGFRWFRQDLRCLKEVVYGC